MVCLYCNLPFPLMGRVGRWIGGTLLCPPVERGRMGTTLPCPLDRGGTGGRGGSGVRVDRAGRVIVTATMTAERNRLRRSCRMVLPFLGKCQSGSPGCPRLPFWQLLTGLLNPCKDVQDEQPENDGCHLYTPEFASPVARRDTGESGGC